MSSIASSPTLAHDRAHKQIFRPFPTPLSWRQWGYIIVMQGIAAMLIDCGANFGIAVAMYSSQKDVRMWVFSKNTIAGDLGVTPIIQTAVSMMITSTLVHTDLHHGMIPPLPFVYPHVEHLPDPRILLDRIFRRKLTAPGEDVLDEKYEPQTKGGLSFYFWMLMRFIFEGTERNMLLANVGIKSWFGRLVWTGLQGAGLGILLGFPLWCLAIVILGPIYRLDNMGGRWAPQAIKGVYGGLYGLYSNPIIAIIALGAQSEHHLLIVPVDEEAAAEGQIEVEVPVAPIHTITEEDEHLAADGTVTPTPSGRATSGFSGPPSPFLRPYRLASTGHSTPAHFRVGEPSAEPPASLSPLRRTRSRSSSISRPPLTCNVSNCLPPPVTAALVEGTVPSPTTPSRLPSRPQRPRALTVSSYVSTSGSSFTYALGGASGRACRSRSNTTTSLSAPLSGAPSGPASSGLPSPSASSRLGVSASPVPQPGFSRGRTHSNATSAGQDSSRSDYDVFGPSTVGTTAPSTTAPSSAGTYLTAPTSVSPSPGVTPIAGIPEVTIQRPSMDVERERAEQAVRSARLPADPLERVADARA